MQLTNTLNLPLSMAVWLGTDDYDHSDNPNSISATTFNKPLRAIVLARQNKELEKAGDVSSLIASRFGTAVHQSVEDSWKVRKNVTKVLKQLGYPKGVIDRIIVNPKAEELTASSIPVYMEIRGTRELNGFSISGKFDFCIQGALEDIKTTGTYGYVNDSNSQDYIRKGSIYRWLHPEIITSDTLTINFVFTDWSGMQARSDKSYPQSKIVTKTYQLQSLAATENYLRQMTNEINRLTPLPQEQLPLCTDKELWRDPDVWKYYKNPAKTTRSTKNFATQGEAYSRMAADKGVGIVKLVKGTCKRCKYCDVVELCNQAKQLQVDGLLQL